MPKRATTDPNATHLDLLLAGLAATPNGCLEWTGRTNEGGYGHFNFKGVRHLTHRVAYELVNGPIPAGMHVCHKCDCPPCSNPVHLFLGTSGENRLDMYAKGRTGWHTRQGIVTVMDAADAPKGMELLAQAQHSIAGPPTYTPKPYEPETLRGGYYIDRASGIVYLNPGPHQIRLNEGDLINLLADVHSDQAELANEAGA